MFMASEHISGAIEVFSLNYYICIQVTNSSPDKSQSSLKKINGKVRNVRESEKIEWERESGRVREINLGRADEKKE